MNAREAMLFDDVERPPRWVRMHRQRLGRRRGRTHVARDAPADLDGSPGLERSVFPFPDRSGVDMGLEVDPIQLLDDVLDFMGNELDRFVEAGEVDVHGDEQAAPVCHR